MALRIDVPIAALCYAWIQQALLWEYKSVPNKQVLDIGGKLEIQADSNRNGVGGLYSRI